MHVVAQSAQFDVEQISVRDLLSQVSRELEGSAILTGDCQLLISEIATAEMSNSVIERLQGVDLLAQTLVELSQLLMRAAAACPADLILSDSLLKSVRLAALRDRLAGKSLDSAAQADPELW